MGVGTGDSWRSIARSGTGPVVVLLLLLAGAVAWEAVKVVRHDDQLEQLRAQLRRASGPADRESITRELAALRQHVDRLGARLRSLETSAPPAGEGPDAADRWRTGYRDELEALRAELEALRAALADSGVGPDGLPGAPALGPEAVSRLFDSWSARQGNNPGAPRWSADQALGAPDTEYVGEYPTAWASQEPDGGLEWLEVTFPRPVVARGIVIVESYNPGAVVKVEAAGPGAGLRSVWSGRDPSTEEANELVVALSDAGAIDRVRITLDTTLVAGWNEIDAVGLETEEGTVWATGATASSAYGREP